MIKVKDKTLIKGLYDTLIELKKNPHDEKCFQSYIDFISDRFPTEEDGAYTHFYELSKKYLEDTESEEYLIGNHCYEELKMMVVKSALHQDLEDDLDGLKNLGNDMVEYAFFALNYLKEREISESYKKADLDDLKIQVQESMDYLFDTIDPDSFTYASVLTRIRYCIKGGIEKTLKQSNIVDNIYDLSIISEMLISKKLRDLAISDLKNRAIKDKDRDFSIGF